MDPFYNDTQSIDPKPDFVWHHSVSADSMRGWTDAQVRVYFSDAGKTRIYAGHDHTGHFGPDGVETFSAVPIALVPNGDSGDITTDTWRIVDLFPWAKTVGWHCGNWEENRKSVGCETAGDWSNTKLPSAAVWAMANWIRQNMEPANNQSTKVWGHRDFMATACPGQIYTELDLIVDMINNQNKYADQFSSHLFEIKSNGNLVYASHNRTEFQSTWDNYKTSAKSNGGIVEYFIDKQLQEHSVFDLYVISVSTPGIPPSAIRTTDPDSAHTAFEQAKSQIADGAAVTLSKNGTTTDTYVNQPKNEMATPVSDPHAVMQADSAAIPPFILGGTRTLSPEEKARQDAQTSFPSQATFKMNTTPSQLLNSIPVLIQSPQPSSFLNRLSSRKLLVTIAFIIIVVLNQTLNWGLGIGTLISMFGVVTTYIGVQGVIDYKQLDASTKQTLATIQKSI